MNYEELVKALRCNALSKQCDSCKYGYHLCPDSECNDACNVEQVYADAAAAIEDLQAQLPKRGEWIRHPEVKNIYGGEYIECPFCGEKYVVQYIADEKFCRNCGTDMRKMEVQE